MESLDDASSAPSREQASPSHHRTSNTKRQNEKRFNLYSVLGVDIKASPSEIRNSYLRLARVWHPDRHQGCEAAKRKFQEVVAAHEVLSNTHKRRQYDLGLLDLLDVEDYLSRFQGLILTACGLGMSASENLSTEDLDTTPLDDATRGANPPPSSISKSGNQGQASEPSRKHGHSSSGWLLTAS